MIAQKKFTSFIIVDAVNDGGQSLAIFVLNDGRIKRVSCSLQ